uniref:Uncharacterized protein n=1 Tax=Arundo donax TaxID=35708 RepID=A0A0A9HY60_ARUDO
MSMEFMFFRSPGSVEQFVDGGVKV